LMGKSPSTTTLLTSSMGSKWWTMPSLPCTPAIAYDAWSGTKMNFKQTIVSDLRHTFGNSERSNVAFPWNAMIDVPSKLLTRGVASLALKVHLSYNHHISTNQPWKAQKILTVVFKRNVSTCESLPQIVWSFLDFQHLQLMPEPQPILLICFSSRSSFVANPVAMIASICLPFQNQSQPRYTDGVSIWFWTWSVYLSFWSWQAWHRFYEPFEGSHGCL
jgi:hypothetical protein